MRKYKKNGTIKNGKNNIYFTLGEKKRIYNVWCDKQESEK